MQFPSCQKYASGFVYVRKKNETSSGDGEDIQHHVTAAFKTAASVNFFLEHLYLISNIYTVGFLSHRTTEQLC